MIKRCICSLIVILTCSIIFSETIPLKLPRKSFEPAGLNPKYTLDIPENFKNQRWGPETQAYNNAVDKFIGTLKSVYHTKATDYLLGIYKLENSVVENNMPDNYIGTNLVIGKVNKEDNDRLSIGSGDVDYLYTNGSDFYYETTWTYVLMKMIYSNGEIYVYYLDGNFWKLNAYHGDGKYPYKRVIANSK